MSEVELIHAMIPMPSLIKIKDDERRPRREPLGSKKTKKDQKDSDQQTPTEHIDEYA